jgi:protein Tex
MVKVHQKVTVTVLDVDLLRKRIALSMKSIHGKPAETLKKEEKKQEKGMLPKEFKPKRFANTPFSEAFRKK